MRLLPQGTLDSGRLIRGIGMAGTLLAQETGHLWRSAFTGALAVGMGLLAGTGSGPDLGDYGDRNESARASEAGRTTAASSRPAA